MVERNANYEITAKFVGDVLFGGRTEITENLLTELEPKQRSKFVQLITDLFNKLKQKFSKNKGMLGEITRLENMFIEMAKSVQQKTTADNSGGMERYSIVTLDNGKMYVKAVRKVITGNTIAQQRKEITNFFNKALKDGPITIETIEGDVLTISKDTAKKRVLMRLSKTVFREN